MKKNVVNQARLRKREERGKYIKKITMKDK